MKSIKELYRIGTGPSSSHTMAPRRAAEQFLARHPEAAAFRVTLYGSLAATGRGHMTDRAIIDTLLPTAPVDIVWQAREFLPFHPNGMRFQALDTAGTPTDTWTVYSIGGGELAEEGVPPRQAEEIYEMNTLDEILAWCRRTGRTYWEYVEECESDDIWDYLAEIWQAMRESVERGLDHEGVLPGPLHLTRRAATYHVRASGYKQSLQSRGLVFAYALAVAEENASGGRIVTAPTCRPCCTIFKRAAVSPTRASTARWPRPACSATSSNTTPRSRAPKWVARARWASPAPWRPPQPTSFSEAAPRRSSMPPKWGSNTIWA